MSKESTKAAFRKAFSAHALLNLSPEELDSIRSYGKSEERIRLEEQLKSKGQTQENINEKETQDDNK
tara:strand:+ start:2301 stop:2501 length:201 start_codon:yes stop_codon:yes gene_type:complete